MGEREIFPAELHVKKGRSGVPGGEGVPILPGIFCGEVQWHYKGRTMLRKHGRHSADVVLVRRIEQLAGRDSIEGKRGRED